MSSENAHFLQTMLPVFFVLAMGYYAGWRGRVDNRRPDALVVVLMQFALPCSLFLGIGSASPAMLRTQLPLLLLLVAVMLLTYGITYLLTSRWTGASASESAVQALTVSFANNVAIGLPLLTHLFGAAGQLAVMCGIVGGALVVSPLTLVLLECAAARNGGEPVPKRVRKALSISLRRPVILAPAAGLLLPLTGHTLPQLFVPSFDLIGKVTIGLALFLTGVILSAQAFRLSRAVLVGVALKNFVQPALVVCLLLLFRMHGLLGKEAFLLACVPAGFFGTVFGARYQVASLESSSTLVLSTLLSIITLPAAIMLAAHLP